MAHDLAAGYARFRGSRLFLLALAGFTFAWIVWNLTPGIPHFDDAGFTRLNVFLSVEASVSVAMLLMATEKQDAMQRRQLLYMLAVMESVRDSLKASENAAARADHDGAAGGPDPAADARVDAAP